MRRPRGQHGPRRARTASGSSSCTSRRSLAAISCRSASLNDVTEPFAPGTTTIRFAPPDSTTMFAEPVSRSTVRRCVASTPAATSASRSMAPIASAPTAPTKLTAPPRRAAAIAWFAPFPPGPVVERMPETVSPRSGARSTNATRSALQLPTTVIRGAPIGRSYGWSGRVVPARPPTPPRTCSRSPS